MSLKSLITEKHDNLRRRRFVIPRLSRDNSIETRLAKRATNSLSGLMQFKSKKSLTKHLKKKIVDIKYSFQCRRCGCFICAR